MLKIGTRGSLLATTQAGHVRDALIAHGYPSELEIVTTLGDVNMAPVERIGVGVFTQALRDALASGVCDVAVHSFKDLPTAVDERFQLIVPKREDPRDCLIARDGLKFAELPPNAVIGTSAPRRIAQLKAMRPDIITTPLRGNIDSRMAKVANGELDAVVLAYAGLSRVGRDEEATEVFDVHSFLPAPAQGALAVECRAGEEPARAAVNSILDAKALTCATVERVVLNRLEAGCTAPVGAYAETYQHEIIVTAAVVSVDGQQRVTASASAPITEAVAVAEEIAAQLLADGAGKIL
jgi:hypothetical protein